MDQGSQNTSENKPEESVNSEDSNVVTDNKKALGKKGLILFLTGMLLTVGMLVYMLIIRDDSRTPTAKTENKQTNSSETPQKETLPFTVPYAYVTDSKSTLYWRPAAGGERTSASELPSKNYISSYDTQGSKVAVVIEGDYEANTPPAIWVSNDSGKSYEKFIDLQQDHQVTSVKFSTDGNAVLYGDLAPNQGKNVVTELLLANKQTKQLFTSDKPGVFVKAYNRNTQQVIYFDGCFNCDGVTYTDVLLRDVAKDETKTIFSSKAYVWTAIKADFSEILVATGNVNEMPDGLGDRGLAPFIVSTVALGSGAATQVTSLNETPVAIGYTADAHEPYVVSAKKITTFKNNNSSVLYEAANIIQESYYVSGNAVFVETASSVDEYGFAADTTLQRFDIEGQKTTNILEADQNTWIFGVTEQ